MYIEVADKSFLIKFKYGGDALKFKRAIEVAFKFNIELSRSVYGTLKYDLNYLFCEAWKANLEKFLTSISTRYNSAKTIKDFTKEYPKLVAEFEYISDAFYSKRPFNIIIYKVFVLRFLSIIRDKLEKMWNKNYDSLGAGDCLVISDSTALFIVALNKWGIQEKELTYYYKPTMYRFMQCLFLNSREILMNMMDEILKTNIIVKGKLNSFAFNNFEGHLFFIIDHYTKFPSMIFLNEVVIYVSDVLAIFFNRVGHLVATINDNPKLFVVFLNSNMLKVIRNIKKKLTNLSGKQFTSWDLRTSLNENYLIIKIGKIFDQASKKLRKYFKNSIIKPFFQQVNRFMDFDFRKVVDKVVLESHSNLSLLANSLLLKESFQYTFTALFKNYAKCFFSQMFHFSEKEFLAAIGKLKFDLSYFKNFCIDDILENSYLLNKHLNSYIDALQSTNIDQIIVGFINLQICFPKIFSQKNIAKVITLRLGNDKQVLEYIRKHLSGEQTDEIEKNNHNLGKEKSKKMTFFRIGLVLYFALIVCTLIR